MCDFPESTRPLHSEPLKKEKRGAQKERAAGSAFVTLGSGIMGYVWLATPLISTQNLQRHHTYYTH